MSTKLRQLYEEIKLHYNECFSRVTNLSDTWRQAIREKGGFYTLEEMLEMLAPGNRVNSWIDDCVYLIDSTVLDLHDPIIKKLLDIGESRFGSPLQDIKINNRYYSSNFTHSVLQASHIIKKIEELNIRHPRIMEIGGGVGYIQYLLVSYFQDRLTYFAVDIPETLLVQEWYMRNNFRFLSSNYWGSCGRKISTNSCLNFINAYIVKHLSFEFDVAINIDSMQEMYASTVDDYVKFIEKNISLNGFFYFQNHFGHTAQSVSEPSEYDLDEYWNIQSAVFSGQFENCDESEQMRIIFQRTNKKVNPDVRRYVLRLLWNGYLSGHFQNNTQEVQEFLDIANSYCSLESTRQRTDELLDSKFKGFYQFKQNDFKNDIYALNGSYHYIMSKKPYKNFKNKTDFIRSVVLSSQALILELFNGPPPDIVNFIVKQNDIAENYYKSIREETLSDYWTAYLSGALFALKKGEYAKELIDKSLTFPGNSPYWLIRYASLCSRFNEKETLKNILLQLEKSETLNFYYQLQKLELIFYYRDPVQSLHVLNLMFKNNKLNDAEYESLGKAAVLFKDYALTDNICSIFIKRGDIGSLLNILETCVNHQIDDIVREFVQKKLQLLPRHESTAKSQLVKELISLRLNAKGDYIGIIQSIIKNINDDDYYTLAWAGKKLLQYNLFNEAHICFERSTKARENSFMHLEFIANAYFENRNFIEALFYYCKVTEIKPYLRHVLARALYCKLQDGIINEESTIHAKDIELLFQRKQDFYYRLSPKSK